MSSTVNTQQKLLENTFEITGNNIPDGAERRQHSRRVARWTATITTRDRNVIQCQTQDVSESGASISSSHDFRQGAVVVLQIQSFYKGAKKTLKILAEVKRSAISTDHFTLGVYFRDLSERSHHFLKQYCENEI